MACPLCYMRVGGQGIRLDKGTWADENYPSLSVGSFRLQPGPQRNRIFSVWELLWVVFARLLFPLLHAIRSCYRFDNPINTVPSYGYFGYNSESSK
jgi:hypothetical protein